MDDETIKEILKVYSIKGEIAELVLPYVKVAGAIDSLCECIDKNEMISPDSNVSSREYFCKRLHDDIFALSHMVFGIDDQDKDYIFSLYARHYDHIVEQQSIIEKRENYFNISHRFQYVGHTGAEETRPMFSYGISVYSEEKSGIVLMLKRVSILHNSIMAQSLVDIFGESFQISLNIRKVIGNPDNDLLRIIERCYSLNTQYLGNKPGKGLYRPDRTVH